ncbi:MAG: FHA domain-containing protein [Desulfobulbaceae bacterium]
MSERRSIILDGRTTSVALESAFWRELERLAAEHHVSWQDFFRTIHQRVAGAANRAAAVKETILLMVKEEAQKPYSPFTAYWQVETKHETKIVLTHDVRVLVGRDITNQLIVNDPEVSRKHAMLVWDNKHWWVIDTESKNGVRLNQLLVAAAKLPFGQVFTIGTSLIMEVKFRENLPK